MKSVEAAACALLISCAAAAPARAEKLITSLSSSRVLITSNYLGADIVLFGAIERDASTVSRAGPYDIVITAKGPRGPVVVRQKQQAGPVWINREQRRYLDVPSYLSVLSTRALDLVTSPEFAERLKIGIGNIVRPPDALTRDFDREADTYRQALIRLKTDRGLYSSDARGVTFLSGNLFRAVIRLPAAAPTGAYEIETRLFAGSAPLAEAQNQLEVSKIGFEAVVAARARDSAWIYGLLICFLAVSFGFIAHVMFRRN